MPLKLATQEGFVPILLLLPKDMVPLDGRRKLLLLFRRPWHKQNGRVTSGAYLEGWDIEDGACLPLGAKCVLPPRSTPSTVEGAGGAFDPTGRR